MFEYPISIPRGSSYDLLGLGPEADPQEISDATLLLNRRLNASKDELNARIERVYKQVEGLREASERFAALQAKPDQANPEEFREAQVRLRQLEREAEKIEPGFKQLRERAKQCYKEIERLSLLKLQNADERRTYDRSHPPLELLKLDDPTRDAFATDQQVALPLLRRELAQYLGEQGEEVFHPTDLTRDDFLGDFTHVELLDKDEP